MTKKKPVNAKPKKTPLQAIEESRPMPASPTIISSLARGNDGLPPGVVGELNRMAAGGASSYAVDEGALIAGGTRKNAVRSRMNKITEAQLAEQIAKLFPDVDPGERAVDCLVLVQELYIPKTMGGGLILRADETIDADQATTTYAKVRSVGPLCFKWDMTGETFPGGDAFKVGDIVRTPQWKSGGQIFLVDDVRFVYWKDRDIKSVIEDLRKIVAIYF